MMTHISIDHFSIEQKSQFADYLRPYISDNKNELIEKILPNRTRYLTLVLEDVFQPHNASAVLRSCEGFGIQDLHIVEQSNRYRSNPDIALGAAKWIDLYHYNQADHQNTETCIEKLRQQQFKVVATSLDSKSTSVRELPLDDKIALFIGKEDRGLSHHVLEEADYHIKIPIYGFTQSFNLSVAAAICMYELVNRMRREGISWQMSEEEKMTLRLKWYMRIIKKSDILLRNFLADSI